MYGFLPVNNLREDCHLYYKAAGTSILGVGDRVIRKTASTDPLGKVAEIQKASVGGAHTGVIVAVEQLKQNFDINTVNNIAAANAGYVLVYDRPDGLLKCIEGGSGSALTVVNVGDHINSITNSDFNTTINASTSGLDNNALSQGNSFIIVGFSQLVNNTSSSVLQEWIVKANLHTEVNNSATNVTQI